MGNFILLFLKGRTLCCGLCFFLLAGCSQVRQLSDVFVKPTPREKYARNFAQDSTKFQSWIQAFKRSLQDSISVALPYSEMITFPDRFPFAYSYDVQLNQGENLSIHLTTELDSIEVFMDIFQYVAGDSLLQEPVFETKYMPKEASMWRVENTGTYKIVLQPALETYPEGRLDIFVGPTLGFPVSDVEQNAIQSFWGAPRAGGSRQHEGVDIFAPRSTPVVAVTDGRVRYVGEKGLGGKQVWFNEGVFGKSFYYAHLDSVNVSMAEKVSKGDTLGFVGNTGNARTTVPHLHFGIYTSKGAIDPLPFIKMTEKKEGELQNTLRYASVKVTEGNFRTSPTTKSSQIGRLVATDTVFILGKTFGWYHMLTNQNERGFMSVSLLNEINAKSPVLTVP